MCVLTPTSYCTCAVYGARGGRGVVVGAPEPHVASVRQGSCASGVASRRQVRRSSARSPPTAPTPPRSSPATRRPGARHGQTAGTQPQSQTQRFFSFTFSHTRDLYTLYTRITPSDNAPIGYHLVPPRFNSVVSTVCHISFQAVCLHSLVIWKNSVSGDGRVPGPRGASICGAYVIPHAPSPHPFPHHPSAEYRTASAWRAQRRTRSCRRNRATP